MGGVNLAGLLLAHHRTHPRPLPWRGERRLYPLWVSEIMLQQTTVATVGPYYLAFIARFPTLASLAAADLEEVLAQWQGLGYYRRARHLHAAARLMMTRHQGQVPETLDALTALPGIGRSTAGAILAIGRDQPHPILDGNVKRVLARLIALEEPQESVRGLATLWETAAALTPCQQAGAYAEAIMDLGATLCTPRRPRCPDCPWREHCQAHAQGREEAFPRRRPRAEKPRLHQAALLLVDDRGRVLLQRRPQHGLLAGLWEPPATAMGPDPPGFDAVVALLPALPPLTPRPEVRHVFTHVHLTVHLWQGLWTGGDPGLTDAVWAALDNLPPMATLHRKLLARKQP